MQIYLHLSYNARGEENNTERLVGTMHRNQSEVARIKQQIEDAYLSSQNGMTGLAEVARHAYITKRMERMGSLTGDLAKIVGDKEASRFLNGL